MALGGGFEGSDLNTAPLSLNPVTIPKANVNTTLPDGFAWLFDDVDDCGASAGPQLFGTNPCGVTTNPYALGASQCADGPMYPVCACNLNVTNSANGFCDTPGFNCAFGVEYFYNLLPVCNCTAATGLSDDAVGDALDMCIFGICPQLYGNNSVPTKCNTLMSAFFAACGSSGLTDITSSIYIDIYESVIATCPQSATSSSTGAAGGTGVIDASSTGYVFNSAPRAGASAATTALLAAATIAATLALSHRV
jgi:hypothetical protein